MGIMATYAGLIYNEFFAIKPNLWGSCYNINNPVQMINDSSDPDSRKLSQKWFWRRRSSTCTYPIGLDPVWGFSENELTLVNNIKMKLSVIFGVFHMSIGIIMKGTNMVFRKKWLEFFTEVVGGFLILFFLFGWMDVLIIAKWFRTPYIGDCGPDNVPTEVVNGVKYCIGEYKNQQIQGIITIMVATVFGFGSYPKDNQPPLVPIIGSSMDQMYSINMALVYIAIILILVMLCTKPCIVKFSGGHQVHEENQIEFQAINQNDQDSGR